jgi:hypothetical protein
MSETKCNTQVSWQRQKIINLHQNVSNRSQNQISNQELLEKSKKDMMGVGLEPTLLSEPGSCVNTTVVEV